MVMWLQPPEIRVAGCMYDRPSHRQEQDQYSHPSISVCRQLAIYFGLPSARPSVAAHHNYWRNRLHQQRVMLDETIFATVATSGDTFPHPSPQQPFELP
jgi:hypothetical protein